MTTEAVVGVLLAAGGGRRAGGPKVLRHDADGTSWLRRAVRVLADAGCRPVLVVLGAAAEQAQPLLPPGAVAVPNPRWADGMAGSLAAGLRAVPPGAAALVHLVDLPDVTVAVAARVAVRLADGPSVLARASFDGRPGHPVLVGSAHVGPLAGSLAGDAGGRDYLAAHGVVEVACGDLATGRDIDLPAAPAGG